MFGRVLSALFTFGGWMAKSVMAKFFLYFGLFFVTTEFLVILAQRLPTAAGLDSAFLGQSAGIWYFWDMFMLSVGIPLTLSAYVLRFTIRRIPVIG